MKKTIIILAAVASLYSCKRFEEDNPVPGNAMSITETNVSDNFSWSTAQHVKLNVGLVKPSGCSYSGPNNPTVYILDNEYNRIKAAVATNNAASFEFVIPSVMKEVVVYLPETGAMKTVPVQEGVNSSSIDIPCLTTDRNPAFKNGGSGAPTCTSGCSNTVGGNVSSLNVPGNGTVCLTGTLNGPVIFEDGGKLVVCGTANISAVTVNGKGSPKGIKIHVSPTGSLTLSNPVTLKQNGDEIINHGTANVGKLTLQNHALLENYKNLQAGDMNLTAQATFNNFANANVGSITNDAQVSNSAKLVVSGNLSSATPPAHFKNDCMVKVSGNIAVDGKFTNAGLISGATATLNGKTNFEMKNGAMLNVTTLNWKGTHVKASGHTSMFKVSGTTTIEAKSKVTGSLDICDANGIETSAVTFKDNVMYCQTFINKDECNDVGFGTPGEDDSDGDGVPDDNDDYPNDPGKAFDTFYPHAGYAINGYEDLWPSKGDYDFNDLVIKYKTHFVQNAQNKYVTASFEVMLNAVGAGLHNGLGIQWLQSGTGEEKFKKITPQLITGVSGQAENVEGTNMVRVYTDVYEVQTTWYNNVGDGPSKAPDTLRFAMTFTTGPTHPANLLPDFYIFRSDDRSHEIHLPDHPATALSNPATYQTFDDDTQPLSHRWFKTTTNLPWGVEIITGTGTFKHPLSKIPISEAYPDFTPWVNSGGTQYQDWYTRPVESKVFQGL